jgi:hypothetical protein
MNGHGRRRRPSPPGQRSPRVRLAPSFWLRNRKFARLSAGGRWIRTSSTRARWHRATDLPLSPTVKRRSAGPASHGETAFRGAAGFREACRRHAVPTQDREQFRRNDDFDASRDPRLPSDQAGSFEREHHLVDGWRTNPEVPLQVRFGRRSADDARIGIDEGQILTLLWREAWYSGRGRHRQLVDRALRGAGDSRSSSSSLRRWRSPSRDARKRSIEACA